MHGAKRRHGSTFPLTSPASACTSSTRYGHPPIPPFLVPLGAQGLCVVPFDATLPYSLTIPTRHVQVGGKSRFSFARFNMGNLCYPRTYECLVEGKGWVGG